MQEVSIEEFKKFKEKVDNFITKEADTFYFRFLMESIYDSDFMTEVSNIIDYVGEERTAIEIEELFKMLRCKAEKQFQIRDEQSDAKTRVDYSLRGLAYFCLVEALNENSVFSERIVEDIKKKYGSRYLEIVSKIDKAFLSVDGRKILESESNELPNDEEMKKYLVMKTWQDEQRTYSMKRIRTLYPKELEYIGEPEPNLIRLHRKTLVKRAFERMQERGIIPLEEIAKYYEAGLDEELVSIVGGKAFGLAKLQACGINIPKTFVVPKNADITNVDLSQYVDNSKKYAIRSSADIEDGGKHSFAGMFDSYLNTDFADIKSRTEDVKNSVNNNRVKKYIEINELTQPSMCVVVQEFREPEYSGVWIGEDEKSGTLEWVKGNGEKLVSGKENPTREIWKNGASDSIEVISANIPVGQQLIEIQEKIGNDSSKIADMEWCILDGKLVLLQFRPVTREVSLDNSLQQKESGNSSNVIYKGSPASNGEAIGRAKYVRRLEELDKWNKGDILMAMFTDPDWMEVMANSSGLVTMVGGMLCHSAIIARELGIPCVTGIGREAMKVLREENGIYVNGTTGEVCTEKTYNMIKKKVKGVSKNDKSFERDI